MNAPGLATPAALEARQRHESGVAQWLRRRTWSRTDTSRWLNDRSPTVLAWLRRRSGAWPDELDQSGYWLRVHHPIIFNAAHTRLAREKTDAAREQIHVGDVLNP